MKDHARLVSVVLELSQRAVDHMQACRFAQATKCTACADAVERRLPSGWLEAYEREQAKLQRSMVGKSRKSPHRARQIK